LDIEKYFPEDHPAHNSTINNQAMLYKINGKYQEAKEMFQVVFSAYVDIYGENHPSTINSLINLATTHKDLNEHDHAVRLYEKAINGRRVTEGENTVNYAMVKAMAAGSYRDLGDFAKSEEYLKESYMTIAMEHGEDNMASSGILNSMGLLYKKQGKFERS
jgi:tetratricopeptide (TPR) repeat protein